MEIVEHAGWKNCIRLANDACDLLVTTDVGPRIVHFALAGGANMLGSIQEHLGQTGGSTFRLYGGHRFWHAPEAALRTYQPDNETVAHEMAGDILQLRPARENATGLRKEVDIELDPVLPRCRIIHRLVNEGCWPVRVAPWALTIMAPGGTAILPQEPYASHPDALLPARPVVIWPYTNMADARVRWGHRFVTLHQVDGAPPIKFGVRNSHGWAVYTANDTTFLKRAPLFANRSYPDFDVNFEFFANHQMLEIETLGPLVELEPGTDTEHREEWFLRPGALPLEEEPLSAALDDLLRQITADTAR